MVNDPVKDLELRIAELELALQKAHEREKYFQEIAKQAGRKRLLETRELSQLVSKYRTGQELLAASSEKLEEVVQKRTKKLKETNQQLQQTIQEQKRIQAQLERLLALDYAILELSSEFINCPVGKIDKAIIHALEKIAHFSDANRVSLYILGEKGDTVLNTHDWKKDAAVEANDRADDFHDHYFQIYLEELRKRRDVIITNVGSLARLIAQPVTSIDADLFQSLLAIPMMQRRQIYGALVLYGERGKTILWRKEMITFVKILSDVFVNALERKVSQLASHESEERYRDLVEKAGLAITMEGADGSLYYFNKHFADLFGYAEKEIAELTWHNLIHPDDLEMVMRHHNDRFQNKKVTTHYDFRGIAKNGQVIYLEVDVVGLKMKNQLMATRSYIWDVTQRVQSERAVHESEERYRNLVENFLDIVVIADYAGTILYANPAFKRQSGYTMDELFTVQDKLNLFPEDADNIYKLVDSFLKSDKQNSAPFEIQLCTKEGRFATYSTIISKITHANKPALQFIAHNITEQKNAEKSLKQSARLEKTISDIMSQFVGSEITNISIRKALKSIGEWSRADRVTLYRVLEDGEYLSSLHEWCARGIRAQKKRRQKIYIEHLEWWRVILRKNGFIHIPDISQLPDDVRSEKIILQSHDILSFLYVPVRVKNKTYGAIVLEDTHMTGRWSAEDIKLSRISAEIISSAFERIEAERMLVRSEEQYRTLFESSNDEIYLYSFSANLQPANFINLNQAACARLGYSKEELLHMNVLDIDDKNEHRAIKAHLKRIYLQKHHVFETIHVAKNGHSYPVEVSSHLIEIEGRPVVLSIARDTTERKRIEEEVQKSQRLESIGVLAGGIAHDFNNLLSIILGNAQLARIMGEQNKDIAKFLQNIEQSAAQASTLTHQLLTFSKGGAPVRDVYPLKDLIKNAVQLALSGLDEHAVFDIRDDLYSAKIDKGQIRQVIHNLILNSDQAMPNGGVIEVTAQNVHSEDVKSLRRLKPGHYVQIRIKDFGIGIPPSEQQKIFDPYYTTKKNGSGLGLTVAYSIIKKHDGLLLLESTVGEGTTVDIFLPAIVQKPSHEYMPAPSAVSYQGSAIVMDDDELVLNVAEEMLKTLGFQVERSKNGEELLSLYEQALQSNRKPDIVIMDMTIPAGMGGIEAIKALRKLDPHVNAIVSSGYSNDKVMSHHREYGFAGVVAKPYTINELRQTIAKVWKK